MNGLGYVINSMSERVLINYVGGAHGHFLEFACNYIFFNIGMHPKDRVTTVGTYHKYIDTPDNKQYILRRKFVARHYWWKFKQDEIGRPKIPIERSNTILNITTNSLEELVLLNMYWRRRGECFPLSPQELLSSSKEQLVSTLSSVKPSLWEKNNQNIKQIGDTAISLYQNDYIDEMTLIKFWIDPYSSESAIYHKSDTSLNDIYVDQIKSSKHVVDFEMNWFYDPLKFLTGIKLVSEQFGLTQLIPDSEIADMVKNFTDVIKEYPDNLYTLRTILEAVKQGNIMDISALQLNDKIALIYMLLIYYDLPPMCIESLKEFPSTTEKLIELVTV